MTNIPPLPGTPQDRKKLVILNIGTTPLQVQLKESTLYGLKRGLYHPSALAAAAVAGLHEVGIASGDFRNFTLALAATAMTVNVFAKARTAWQAHQRFNRYAPVLADLYNLAQLEPSILDRRVSIKSDTNNETVRVTLRHCLNAFATNPTIAYPEAHDEFLFIREEATILTNLEQELERIGGPEKDPALIRTYITGVEQARMFGTTMSTADPHMSPAVIKAMDRWLQQRSHAEEPMHEPR